MIRPYACPCDGDDANCARCDDHTAWCELYGDADELDVIEARGDDAETESERWTNPPRPMKEPA